MWRSSGRLAWHMSLVYWSAALVHRVHLLWVSPGVVCRVFPGDRAVAVCMSGQTEGAEISAGALAATRVCREHAAMYMR